MAGPMGAEGCSPFGPPPSPPSSSGTVAAMPLGWTAAPEFTCVGAGGLGGFFPGAAAPVGPVTINAFSSGGGPGMGQTDVAAGLRFGWITGPSIYSFAAIGMTTLVTVPGGGSIPANSGTALTITVPGVRPTDSVWANQTSAVFPSGMSIVNAFCATAGQVTLQILNCTTSSQSVPVNFPCRIGALRGPV